MIQKSVTFNVRHSQIWISEHKKKTSLLLPKKASYINPAIIIETIIFYAFSAFASFFIALLFNVLAKYIMHSLLPLIV